MKDLLMLKSECMGCQKCALAKGRKNVVFGVGAPDAEVMFIGEGPGEQEDIKGEPFVGAAGKLLDHMLNAIGLNRNIIYIANIVKCRPPANRDPLAEEQDACIPYLYEQIELIKPRIIVCLGRIAAMRLIGPEFKITRDHGIWYEKGSAFITAVYHPSALLRDPSKKTETFFDLKSIENKIKETCKHTYI